MYELSKKDLVSNGEIIRTWSVDYEEFDVDLNETLQNALVVYDGNYYVVEINGESGDTVFPDEQAVVLDIQYERINNTFTWNQIQDFIPDEDLEVWDDAELSDEDWGWEVDNE